MLDVSIQLVVVLRCYNAPEFCVFGLPLRVFPLFPAACGGREHDLGSRKKFWFAEKDFFPTPFPNAGFRSFHQEIIMLKCPLRERERERERELFIPTINVLLTYVQDGLGGIRESQRHISRLEFISCRIQKCTSKLVGLAAREGQARCLFCSFSAALDLSHQPRLALCFLAILSIIKKRWGGAFGRVVECGHKCLPQTASNKIPCHNHPCPVFAANSEWLMLEAVMKSYDDSSGAATAAALRLHTPAWPVCP